MKTMIEVNHLSKSYRLGGQDKRYRTLREDITQWFRRPFTRLPANRAKTFWALRDIHFEVKRGEVVGVIGRNGAGKSTLLKILSRITYPTSGGARLRGRAGSLLEVGTGFHPELTGRENIYLSGTILGMKRHEIKSKFDDIADFAGVEQFLDTPVKHYSSGMYVRLAFAVAAHLEPEILLIDEVLAVGDHVFQKKCLGKMMDVAQEGKTILFVSHNMAVIQHLCTRAILLHDGKMLKDAKAADTIHEYVKHAVIPQADMAFKVNAAVLASQDRTILSIRNIAFIDDRGAPLRHLKTGDSLRVRIHYESHGHCIAPAFVLSFKSALGVEIIRLSTMPISGYEIPDLFPRGVIELTIPHCPLASGYYRLDFGFVRSRVEWILKLEDIVSFYISPHDVYGSGEPLDQNRSLIVTPHTWNHAACGQNEAVDGR